MISASVMKVLDKYKTLKSNTLSDKKKLDKSD